jgi:hypothetical protein
MRQTGNKILDYLSGVDEALHPLSTSTLKTEKTNCYETLVSIHKSIRRHVKADEKVTSWITMNMDAVSFSETSMPLLETTPRHTSEDRRLRIYNICSENT